MQQDILLTIIAPPGLEEALVDWLLEIEPDRGFSSSYLSGHSSRHAGLTLAEQVSGRKKQVRFEMHLPEPRCRLLIERLMSDFRGADLHYWMSEVMVQGRI